ncbi:uncharacterized protein BX664DRAFT_329825 [Halteromyces radiatus]|uniref:uncharacterized protein n=1 Tax=Halteromyces radiatus TaxID=101107 RepID=UPI00221E693F|nr:uncharacterized protein BX664DRAFT_329825 [Halteromyces radiatus]KAI8093487.1 hypothetical protein BX664DRAFT_329825 [Halteromyces radiatus]
MHRFIVLFTCLMMMVQAAPVPQVWMDEQGDVFAIALDATFQKDATIPPSTQLLLESMNDIGLDEDEDNMYTISSTALVMTPDPSVKDKIINYVNTMFTISS